MTVIEQVVDTASVYIDKSQRERAACGFEENLSVQETGPRPACSEARFASLGAA